MFLAATTHLGAFGAKCGKEIGLAEYAEQEHICRLITLYIYARIYPCGTSPTI